MHRITEMERVVDALVAGGRLLASEALPGGASATVIRLDIATNSGDVRRVVFRQHRPSEFKDHGINIAAMEFSVLHRLHSAGLPVPEPLLLARSSTSVAPYLVTEWIDGTTVVHEPDLPSALEQMASFLTQLHTLDTAALEIPGLEQIESPSVGALRFLSSTGAGAEARRTLMRSDAVQLNPSGVVHGDFWPGNVMWRNGQLVAVIDWEDACFGDPLADLATARVELLCRFGPDAAERFTTLYLERSTVPLRLASLPAWDIYVSASALATMHEWGLDPTAEASRRGLTEHFLRTAGEQLAAS